VVRRDPVHVDRLLRHAAKEVPAAHHNADLAAQSVHRRYLFRNLVNEYGVDAEAFTCGQGFPGELEKNAFVHVSLKYLTPALQLSLHALPQLDCPERFTKVQVERFTLQENDRCDSFEP
jgi:hypothetical protein